MKDFAYTQIGMVIGGIILMELGDHELSKILLFHLTMTFGYIQRVVQERLK